jgi:hypothetical protein
MQHDLIMVRPFKPRVDAIQRRDIAHAIATSLNQVSKLLKEYLENMTTVRQTQVEHWQAQQIA